MSDKKKRAKVLSRKLSFNKKTGELYLSPVYEFPRPEPKENDTKESGEPP